jgi:hypothetical protein
MGQRGIVRAVLVVLLLAAVGRADTISFHESIPLTETDWSDFLTFDQFDPSLGVLNSVELELTGPFEGSMRLENESYGRVFFSMSLAWGLELFRPDQSLLITVEAAKLEEGLLDPYDGQTDFSGSSGVTFDVAAEPTDSALFTDPGDLELFTGSGTIDLPIAAVGEFTVEVTGGGEGPQSYVAEYDALAGAEVTLTYDYIPEPGSLVLLSIGGLAILSRKR